ncbi:MAG TPA: TonB-dependent receptor, partial [Bacteroidales bacterium]|nr:TonB-dependent receptor [Bacteroidales bacterium]
GTHTGADGVYMLQGMKNAVYRIRFSFLGYETQIIEIRPSVESVLNIIMIQQPFLAGEVIINATRAGSRSPLAYTTLENELISRQNSGHDIPYLLSLTPSLVETSEAGNGIGYTNMRIRGTDASRINVTIDGIPLNDAESQQVFWVDIPDIASSVDNIQIQRGVGTSSNGAGAFGATVNIQTKNPDNEPFAQISTSFGSFNTSRKMITAGSGLLADRFAFQLRLSDMTSDGYIDRTGSNHQSAFINGVYRTDRSFLKTNIILGKEHTQIGWWGVPGEMLSINRKYNPAGEYTDEDGAVRYYENESDNYNQNHYQLIYDLRAGNNLSLSTAFHYTYGKGYYEEFREDRSLYGYGLPDIIIGNEVISETDLIRRKWMRNDFYGLVYSLKYKKNKLETIFGGGANYYSGDHFGRIIWMKYSGNTGKDHQWYFNNGKKGEVSIFGKADYQFSGQLSFFADLQYRYINYRMEGIDDDLKDLGQKHNYSFFNPKTGLFYSFNANQDAYLSFSVANREPTRADFKEAAGDPEATPEPETLYDTELGYKRRSEKYSLAVNLYLMLYKDQLVPTGELSSTGYPIMTNVEKSRRSGIEFITSLRPARWLGWDFNLTLSSNKIRDFVEHYLDYNTNDWSEEYKSKNPRTVDIAYSPSLTGSGDINFKVLRNTGIHFISKYVGRQYFDNTMSHDRMIDPYFVNNLRIDFHPEIKGIKNTGFQLFINNIFNSKYESNAYGGNWYEDGIEKTWSYFFPQAGINFMVKAEFMF